VSQLCSLCGVRRGSYYAWRRRGESTRRGQDRVLLGEIQKIFKGSRGTYGSPRVHRALRDRGLRVSRRRVERLMRGAELRARVVQVYRANRGLHRFFGRYPNLLGRTRAARKDRIWVGDVTYLKVARSWHFLALVMDQYSRRVLGWRLGLVRSTKLTRAAFDGAMRRRKPSRGLIFHSDRGSEYQGSSFGDRLRDLGVRQSMTRGGSPGDNPHAESFFHSLKADALQGLTFKNVSELRRCLQAYVRYYNHRRMHSSLGYRSPVEFERRAA
jgi:putative transposase